MDSTIEYSTLPEVVVSTDNGHKYGYRPYLPPKTPDVEYRPVQSTDVHVEHTQAEGTIKRPTVPRQQSSQPMRCCVCDKAYKAWKCVQCDDFFCDYCWDKERPHLPGKVGIDGRKHEKVDEDIVRRLQQIFGRPSPEEQHRRHANDINTTWFGVTKEAGQPYLHYSNRLIDILRDSQMGDFRERFPQLVSFVGQTGAGKSTVIKMLIDRQQARLESSGNIPAPVPGLVGDNVPTTGDVHLYEDPGTYHAQSPVLYADCEGMTGGENAPRGLACREKVEGARKSGKLVKNALRKRITWADNPKMQSREYSVTSLFPRILYTFSDVVVFVLREVRTFQTEVLTQLVNWAAMSIDKSINQPTLPHVIIVANYTDTSIDDQQWNPVIATKGLLNDYEDSVRQVPALREILARLETLGKDITTTKGLLEYYYSSVTVVRVPAKGRYMQMDTQIGKLYNIILDKCARSHAQKKKVRMLLNAEVLPHYVNAAYDHFSSSLDEPFDFIEEARRHAPLPQNFGGHILNFIMVMYNHAGQYRRRVKDFFVRLSLPLASCIMLAATRDNIQGSYSHLLRNTYSNSLHEALEQFCDQWLRCSYSHDGETCQNARNSHQKGHQAASGRIIARGPYESNFILDEFFPDWINKIDEHIKSLDTRLLQYDQVENVIPRVLVEVMAKFYVTADSSTSNLRSNLTCLCCIRRIPESVLPCGHILCKACIQAHGVNIGQGLFHMRFCPLHRRETPWLQPAKVRFKPDEAGVRILCLDGGGVRAIVQTVMLEAIEDVLGGHVPIQNFFDLIVGSSTGGVIALGLGVKRWGVAHCREEFKSLCKQAFTSRFPKAFAAVSIRSQYKTKPLERGLRSAFDQHSYLYGGSKIDHSTSIRVAVTSTIASENRPAVISNYNAESEHDSSSYKFIRPQDPTWELKVWEAARATAAAPPYFKPFVQETTGEQYTDGAIHHLCPVHIADNERRLIWGEVSHWAPDILLSLGTGFTNTRLTHKAKRISSQRSPEVAKSRQSPQQWASSSFSSMWRTPSRMIDDQTRSEDIWGRYLDRVTAPAHAYTDLTENRNMRINVEWHDKRPDLDDIEQMEDIERHAMHRMSDNRDIEIAAHKLVASCFYFEKTSVDCQSREGGVYKCSGNIFCRFDEGSRDLKGLGSILKDHIRGSVFVPFFVLEEDHGTSFQRQHDVVIPIQTIEQMRSSGTFRLPSHLVIDGRHESSLTRLSLCLEPEGYIFSEIPSSFHRSRNSSFSISGFPRELFTQDNPLSPRILDDEAGDGKELCELEANDNSSLGTEVRKESVRRRSVRRALFGNAALPDSISQLSLSSRPSSSEDRGAATANSKETGSVSSGRRSNSEELPSKVADVHSESGYEERKAPFRGYY